MKLKLLVVFSLGFMGVVCALIYLEIQQKPVPPVHVGQVVSQEVRSPGTTEVKPVEVLRRPEYASLDDFDIHEAEKDPEIHNDSIEQQEATIPEEKVEDYPLKRTEKEDVSPLETVVGILASNSEHSMRFWFAKEYSMARAELKSPMNIAVLEDIIENSVRRDSREAAATVLARIGTAKAIKVLVKHAGKKTELSGFYAKVISEVSSNFAQQVLLDVVKETHHDSKVRIAAAKALGGYHSIYVMYELSDIISSETDEAVQSVLEDSIQSIDDQTDHLVNLDTTTIFESEILSIIDEGAIDDIEDSAESSEDDSAFSEPFLVTDTWNFTGSLEPLEGGE